MHDLHQPMGSTMSGLQHPADPQGTPGTARAGPASHGDAPLRCFLVEDNPVIRQNLIATLEEMLAVEVIGTAEDEPAAVQWMRTPGETALSDAMIGYWTSFARDGRPRAANAPDWAPYGPERAYMHFTDTPHLSANLMPGMYELNEEVVCRRNAAGGIGWNWNVGLWSPRNPPATEACRQR